MPGKAKNERKALTKRLDDLCREIVRIRDNNLCQKCHKHVTGQDNHPSHVVAKGKGASQRRFDLLNIKVLCFHCHRWWHDNPTESGPWFMGEFPARDAYLRIYRCGKPAKISTPEMRELVDTLKAKLEELKGEAQ
jgi:hypothetical protein